MDGFIYIESSGAKKDAQGAIISREKMGRDGEKAREKRKERKGKTIQKKTH